MVRSHSWQRLRGRRRTRRALFALTAIVSAALGVTVPAASADGGHLSADFIAAEPSSYDHATGAGGVYGSRTIGTEVVESLEGGDFACGDTVVFFTAVDVDPTETEEHTVEFDFEFLAQSTGQDGVGFDSITGVSANTGDSGHVTNGNESVTLVTQSGGHPGPQNLTGTVEITNLGVGDTQFILRIETLLACTPGATPTGNLQAQLTAGRVTAPSASTVNTGEQTIPFKQAGEIAFPSYALTKTADPEGPVNAGDDIGFDIVLTNTGNVPLADATISDPLPGGLDWAEDPDNPDCSIAGGVLSCDFGDVEVAGVRTVSVVATTSSESCGLLENTATASSGNAGELMAGDDVYVQCPTVDITKVASDGVDEDGAGSDSETFNAGDTIGFDIQISVGGEGSATDVEVSDTLPTLPSGGTWTLDPAVDGCSIDGQELSCSFDSLDAGTVIDLHVEAPTTPADCEVYDNTASVTTGNDGGDDDSASLTVQCPNVRVEKVALDGLDEDDEPSAGETVNAGSTAGFAITVTNDGPGAATDVTLEDTLPAGFDWAETPDDPTCDIAGLQLSCEFASLDEGESVTVTVTAPTAPELCGVHENTATVDTDGDTNAEDNISTAELTVICPDLDITKVADDETVDAGEPIGFTITVSNGGPGTATDVTLEDDLSDLDDDGQPDGLVWTENSEACSVADQVLNCDFGDLAAGADASVHLSAETSEELCATYTNVAVASASNNPDVDDSDSTTVLCPGLNVAKTADEPLVDAGYPIGFALEVSNSGPGNALGVTLEDPLPGGEGIDWAITGTEGVDAGCAIDDDDVLTCGPVDLGVDESLTVMVQSPTEFASCAVYDNTAVADADNSAPLESSASATVECPDLEIEKTADAEQVDAGDDVGFLISLTNNGPGAATDVVVTDELPTGPGIEWTGAATNEGCAIADDLLTCEIDELAAGETFIAHVSSPTTEEDCAVYHNVVEAGAGNHGTLEAEASTEVVCPPPPTTVPPTIPPRKPPLPMTGGYQGLLALLGVLLVVGGALGVWLSRRRRGDALS